MRITASHIIDWANTHAKEAQANLPRWVRRLCFNAEVTRQLTFPAGDSSFVPGWDGILSCERGNAWVPAGSSRWEIGCDQNIPAKANGDYQKRTEQTSIEERLTLTFVFVTPRRWIAKNEWISAQKAKGEWADIRVIDADDLEQWLEQSPSVALQFGEELGLVGPGVESCLYYWNAWSQQCSPVIRADALFVDRKDAKQKTEAKIREALSANKPVNLLAIRADSAEEAVAFVVATILENGDLADHSLVVTNNDGWRYVNANTQLKIAVAINPETAQRPVLRSGLLVVVPHVSGNFSNKSDSEEIVLERPQIYEYEKALIATGIEESDARRLAASTGRSWTILRRQLAKNPAISSPSWLSISQSSSLAMLCLLGTWNADKDVDRQVVSRLAERPYEVIDGDLRRLAQLDDAPVLCIGSVWKAKSPLELLALFGNQLTQGQLDRFFSIAREMLEAPDPQLELPDEERWMAQVHGKVHLFSGLIFEAICDSLVKLAVRGPELPELAALRIPDRVESLVSGLLNDADSTRWLSLASHLPTLAEAAPDVFLGAIERSLKQPDPPVLHLLSETSGSGFSGRCWHAGLLWALETISWNARRLARVALILAKLSHRPIKGNWANTPLSSLCGLFRSWLPQTAAPLQSRIQVLDLVVARDSDIAFRVLVDLVSPLGCGMAMSAARPKWRDDDAGVGHGVPHKEAVEMQAAAKKCLFQICHGHPHRIARLFQDHLVDSDELPQTLCLMEPFTQASSADDDREILRAALRSTIHWHRHYDDKPAEELDLWLAPIEACYSALEPAGLVLRHRWLFDSYSVDLPCRERNDDWSNRLTKIRDEALQELFSIDGMHGIEELTATCQVPETIGASLAKMDWEAVDWANWIATNGGDFHLGSNTTRCIGALFCAMPSPNVLKLLRAVLSIGNRQGWERAKLARLLSLAIPHQDTWQLVSECGPEIEKAYWECVQPDRWRHAEDLPFVLQQLLKVKRPRTALQCCQYHSAQTDPTLLFAVLSQFMAGEEPDGPIISSWHLGEMLAHLEKSGDIEKSELIQLEFGLFPALGYEQEARAAMLYESVLTDPSLFTELITLAYKPKNREREELLTEVQSVAARHAWKLLRACKRMPGTKADGQIDVGAFFLFIDSVRELCRQADRLEVCDLVLGEILAYAPADEDGTWPFFPAREVLERSELEDMRSGFRSGAFNKRGVTCRSPWDGGAQERDLAAYYLDQAERVQCTHPNVAALLEDIAKNYEFHGRHEDNQADLRKEGF